MNAGGQSALGKPRRSLLDCHGGTYTSLAGLFEHPVVFQHNSYVTTFLVVLECMV